MAIILVQLRPNCRRRAERRSHAATILGQKKSLFLWLNVQVPLSDRCIQSTRAMTIPQTHVPSTYYFRSSVVISDARCTGSAHSLPSPSRRVGGMSKNWEGGGQSVIRGLLIEQVLFLIRSKSEGVLSLSSPGSAGPIPSSLTTQNRRVGKVIQRKDIIF